MHDCALTQDYFVVVVAPLLFNTKVRKSLAAWPRKPINLDFLDVVSQLFDYYPAC